MSFKPSGQKKLIGEKKFDPKCAQLAHSQQFCFSQIRKVEPNPLADEVEGYNIPHWKGNDMPVSKRYNIPLYLI